jgi:outer membrane autotransporter protein
VTAATLVNNGQIALTSPITLTGAYDQSISAVLRVGGGATLTVTGAASIATGGEVSALFSSVGNYTVGDSVTLIVGGVGSSLSGATVTSSLAGLSDTGSVSGNSLLAIATNDYIGGTMSAVTNVGTISGVRTGVYIASTGSLGTLTNTGVINANFHGAVDVQGGVLGTLINSAGATLTASAGDVVGNEGTISVLNNAGLIAVGGTASRGITNGGGIGTLTNSGTITGGATSPFGAAIYDFGASGTGTIGALNNSGSLSGWHGIDSDGTIGTLINSGSISASQYAIDSYSGGSIGTLVNSGYISGVSGIHNAGTIGVVNNQIGGTISGSEKGLANTQGYAIGTLTNAGVISVQSAYTGRAINNQGSIGTLVNSGTVTVSSTGSVFSNTQLWAVTNGANATITSFNNSGLISGGPEGDGAGIGNYGTITTLSNSGTITSSVYGIQLAPTGIPSTGGTIGSIVNSGVISGGVRAISYEAGSIGPISNTGTIAGNIFNGTSNNLTITGGSGVKVGTLTGYAAGSIGTINNSGANLVLGGNLLLNDNVVANTVVNSGGSLALNNTVSVTGAFTQASGNLSLASGAELVVTGAASITGGTIVAGLSTTSNYTIGQTLGGTLVAGGTGSNYTGVGVSPSFTGLAVTSTVSGTSLLLGAVINDYVGGTLSSLTNGATISGVAYPVYVASTGNLGTLTNSGVLSGSVDGVSNHGTIGTLTNSGTLSGANYGLDNNQGLIGSINNTGVITGATRAISYVGGSIGVLTNVGTIAGNIVNSTANTLTIGGGAGAVQGTLTGYSGGLQGTITNTGGNLFLTGNQLLDDTVNLGVGGLFSSGNLQINRTVNVTGAFTQIGGSLRFGVTSTSNFGNLFVSGAASLSNASVMLIPLTPNVLAAGQNYTIVSAAGGLTTSGLTSTVTGFASALNASGHSLVLSLTTTPTTTSTSTPTPTPTTTSTPPDFTQIGAQGGGGAAGVGTALQAILGSSSPAASAFNQLVIPVLTALTPAQQVVALKQLAPSPVASQLSLGAGGGGGGPVAGAVSSRQASFGADASGRQYASLDGDDDYAGLGKDGGRGMWGKLLGGGATRSDDAGAAPYTASFYGLVFGADVYRGDQALVGLAGSWIDASASGAASLAGSQTRLNSYQLTAYGSAAPSTYGGRLSIDGQLAYGYNTYSQTRQIDFLGARAASSYSGQQYLASATVGYAFAGRNVTWTPYGGFSEAHLVNGGYGETGAGVADMQVASNTTDTFSSEFGVKLDSRYDTAYGKILPTLKLGWTHDYTSGPIAITGTLAGVTFASASARPAADAAAIGAGLTLQRSGQWKIGVEYQGDIRKDFQSHTGALKATFNF